MARYGYFLSSEEYEPASLIDQARMAEEAGFDALWISDHYHPWLDEQGQSSFVWSVIGAMYWAVLHEVTLRHMVGGRAVMQDLKGTDLTLRKQGSASHWYLIPRLYVLMNAAA